ncbi:PHD and RING finger domain-containing protein 1 [Morus notabilis]|uniref:PHD and RING finger domain-containing protein 1 n=1 Tax=Morus notabilis TaxID=981085 RepID=W9S2Z7_9ROSA|nr:midasin [Morus notabilis]EXC11327.1 PHD and RING finger domain-containing protein 1 [Morus notabilis]
MVRGGKVSSKRKFRKWDRYNDKASDDSDEDYVVSDEENEVSDYSDEDYCSSVDGHASEESFGSFVEEEEEEEEEEEGTRKRVKKVGRSKPKKRARRFIVEEEDEDEQEEEEEVGDEDREEDEVEDEEMNEVKTTARSKVQMGFSRPQKNGVKPSQKRRIMFKEDEVDDDDDEFTPNNDEEDEVEDEEMNAVKTTARSKVQRGFSRPQKNGVKPSQKRRVTYKEDEVDDDDDEFTPNNDEENEVEDEEMNEVKTTARSKVQRGFSRPQKNGVKPSQKRRVTYKEDEVDDDDDEFTPNNDEDEEDEVEDEEMNEVKTTARSKVQMGFSRPQKNGVKPSQKRRITFKEDEVDDDDDEFTPNNDEEDEVEDEEMNEVKTTARSKVQRGFSRPQKNGVKPSQKRRVTYKEDEVDGDDDEFTPNNDEEDEVEDEEMNEVKTTARSKVQRGLSRPQKNGVKPSQKRRVTYKEDGVDDDDDDEFTPNNDEEDEEFKPDDDDCSDEEESRAKKKKNNAKAGKRVLQKKGPAGGRKRRRKSMASKKPLRKTRGFRRKVRSDGDDDGDFMDNGLALRDKGEMRRAWKRRLYTVPSDSDFASSGSSEYKYTISEEEREQVREAREYCGKLKTNLRSSSASNKIQEDVVLQPERKPTGRKGKEKVEEVKAEVVRQVCGICLSEEDKRKVRGTLNCCTHYFCFPCIMEWAKVESRCPLCKQRFNTISKTARNTAGIDLREMAIQVPERDQVYQPSEEELRSYIDPYENVICTECHEGGDDGLMLLCDLCDSPAHTYCVGLGREVPEGNWYCDGCRPVATGSSSSPAQTRLSDQRTTSSTVSDRASTVTNYFIEGLDLNSVYSQGFGSLSSPRYHFGGFQVTSPLPGAGAPTLFGRRLIHRHIQQLLSVNRMGHMADRHEGNSGANLISDLNSPLDQGRETPRQRASTQEMGVVHAFFRERLRENLSTPV